MNPGWKIRPWERGSAFWVTRVGLRFRSRVKIRVRWRRKSESAADGGVATKAASPEELGEGEQDDGPARLDGEAAHHFGGRADAPGENGDGKVELVVVGQVLRNHIQLVAH